MKKGFKGMFGGVNKNFLTLQGVFAGKREEAYSSLLLLRSRKKKEWKTLMADTLLKESHLGSSDGGVDANEIGGAKNTATIKIDRGR